jgi:hypothetical protein
MKPLCIVLFSLMAITGCVTSIDSVDTKGKNQACVRQCTETYSRCIGNAMGMPAQSACASGFRACANTCPDK